MNTNNILLLYKISKYYYSDHLSQQEIAEMLNISRPQISRMLKKAYDLGIVEINVKFPDLLSTEQISNKLEDHLKDKRIILTPSHSDGVKNDEALYSSAAEYLADILKDSKYIGIGWGQTLYNISLRLPFQDSKKEQTFIAVSGTSGTSNPYFQTNNIVDRFAERYHGNVYYNNFSSFLDTVLLSPLERKRFQKLQRIWEHLDTLIVGLASVTKSQENYLEEFENPDFFNTVIQTMTGEILGNFFSKEEEFHFSDTTRISSLELSQMHKIKNVICIAHGSSKVNALLTALQKDYIKTLITDKNTGQELLQKLETHDLDILRFK